MSLPGERAEIDIQEEVDLIDFDPSFYERQRSRYASRGVGLIILLNGIAAIALLVVLADAEANGTRGESLADAMVVFATGAAVGLLSKFFAYLRRTIRLERPDLRVEGRPFRWLAVAAAVAGAICFVAGFIVARDGVMPSEPESPAAITKPEASAPNESPPANQP